MSLLSIPPVLFTDINQVFLIVINIDLKQVLSNIKWPETLETDFIYSEKTINFAILK
jgi:hypothetical protein